MHMDLDEIVKRLQGMPVEEREKITQEALAVSSNMRWIPSPGPQTEAYFSKADILLYGGEPGGGKTALLVGLAFTAHKRSLIMRRQYTDLQAIIDYAVHVNGSRVGLNSSPPPSFKISDNQKIEFGAAVRIGDEQHWMGNPHDLIGFDEATHFAEIQIRFLMGWMRTTDPNQRCRVVLATNPPLSSEGAWVVDMFAPWLDPRHPNPAKPGELRWFVNDENGKDVEVDGPDPVLMKDGRTVSPLSRTYIPASLSDNPYLSNTDYQKTLDNMPEALRSILLGGFLNSFRDAPNQCIPVAWVKEAQKRWTPNPPLGIPMCAMGVDVAQGGPDDSVLAPRHDAWFANLITKPGHETPLGSDVAGMIVSNRRDNALVVLDMGGGYGGSTYEHLVENNIPVLPYKGAAAVESRTKDRQLKFVNKRTEAYWRFREALDPSQEGGSTIALPPDPKLTADLTAPTFTVTPKGIKLETKEDVCERLGRSTDRGDAVVMAWTGGPKYMTDGGEWIAKRETLLKGGHTPRVVGSKNMRGRR